MRTIGTYAQALTALNPSMPQVFMQLISLKGASIQIRLSTASEFGHAAYSKYTSSLYRLIKFSSEYCKNYSNAQISLELARYEVRKMAFSIHFADFSKLALVNRKKGLSLEIGICTCIRVIFLIWQTRTLKFNYKTKQKLIMLEH